MMIVNKINKHLQNVNESEKIKKKCQILREILIEY
jgi:hypothetical protein